MLLNLLLLAWSSHSTHPYSLQLRKGQHVTLGRCLWGGGLRTSRCGGGWTSCSVSSWGGEAISSRWSSWSGLAYSLHAGHPPPKHLGLLQPVLQLLLPELVLDVQAERNRTLVLLTVLSMIAAQSDELLADGTATVGFSLAAFRMLNDTFHLLARRQGTVCISTLARVDKRLDAALDAKTA